MSKYSFLLKQGDVLDDKEIDELTKNMTEENKNKIAKSFFKVIPTILKKYTVVDPLLYERMFEGGILALANAIKSYKPGAGSLKALIYTSIENEMRSIIHQSTLPKYNGVIVSLDTVVVEDGGGEEILLKDMIEDDFDIEKKMLLRFVYDYIDSLEYERDKDILMRYCYRGETQSAIAKRHGLTQKGVHEVIKKHYKTIRELYG